MAKTGFRSHLSNSVPAVLRFAFIAYSCAFIGCLSESHPDKQKKTDPYLGLTCNQLALRLNEDTQKFNASQLPLKFEFPEWESCPLKAAGPDSSPPLNEILSTITVWSNQALTANVKIYDYQGALVRTIRQSLGYSATSCGNLNPNHKTADGLFIFYILWDGKDLNGMPVDDGAYLWEVGFETSVGLVRRTLQVGIYGKCQSM